MIRHHHIQDAISAQAALVYMETDTPPQMHPATLGSDLMKSENRPAVQSGDVHQHPFPAHAVAPSIFALFAASFMVLPSLMKKRRDALTPIRARGNYRTFIGLVPDVSRRHNRKQGPQGG